MTQSLGYNVAPVGVPTAAAYGDRDGMGAAGGLEFSGLDPNGFTQEIQINPYIWWLRIPISEILIPKSRCFFQQKAPRNGVFFVSARMCTHSQHKFDASTSQAPIKSNMSSQLPNLVV